MSKRGVVEANWKPLESRLGAARCAGFMFMGRVKGINLYKHGISRTYLYMDDDGNCYVARKPGCYLPADFDKELFEVRNVFEGLGGHSGNVLRRKLHRTKAGNPSPARGFPAHDSGRTRRCDDPLTFPTGLA